MVDSDTTSKLYWAYLIHLGYNMWEDRESPVVRERRPNRIAADHLRCDKQLWDELTERLAAAGANLLVIDLGEGVRYESHPELGVKGAWSTDELRAELARLRSLGLQPVPKLNFATTHDHWLGPYSRCVSTDTYYGVCRDLIEEVCALFEQPPLFHLGMDEETAAHQKHFAYAVVRQHELWWHDLQFLVEQVQRHDVRPWVFSDYVWHHHDAFYRNMPKTVMQSNWYYGMPVNKNARHKPIDKAVKVVQTYLDLDAAGYDQMPVGGNHSHRENFARTVSYLCPRLDPDRLKGFLHTPWRITLPESRDHHLQAIDTLAEGRQVGEALQARATVNV